MSFSGLGRNALPRAARRAQARAQGKGPSRAILMARLKPLPPVPRRGNKPLPQLPVKLAQNKRRPRRRNAGQSFARPSMGRMGGGPSNPMGKGFPSGNYPRGSRWCRVEEDEFIADVNGSVTFANTAFPVNPGQASTFPWLSKQAAQWEKYRWEYLEFYYKPEVSAFATNGSAGKVILSMDYDAADAPPATKQNAEDTDPHADAMPYEDLLLVLDPYQMFEMADSKYVRPAGLPGGTDIKTYDSGNINVSTIGNTNTTLIGELHVRYAVVFEVPVLESAVGAAGPANNQAALFQSTAAQTNVTATPTTQLVATAKANGLGIVNTAGSMVPPAGNYLVDYSVAASDSAAEAFLMIADFQKNGASVWQTAADVPRFAFGVSLGATQTLTQNGSTFVTANGTDAFTLVVTETGPAGVLTAGSSVRWVAI